MRVTIAAVGRCRAGPEQDLYTQYARRLVPPPTLVEVEERRRMPVPDRVAAEGTRLLAAVPSQAACVVLDERGTALASRDLADRLARWQAEGSGLACLIGGADGHAPAVRERADLLLSLGPMTWPHQLVRAMLAEQLYRVQCILSGHPYHRG